MTNFLRVKLPAAVAIVTLASYCVFLEVQASQESDERIGPSAVWNPGDQDLQQINDDCRRGDPENYGQCFADHMAERGASPEAIDFTGQYALEHNGAIAILRDFQPVDTVDVGRAYFPDRNESRQTVLLLNGTPEVLDLGDLNVLPNAQLTKDAQFAALRRTHPQVGIFPGNNTKTDAQPRMQTPTNGGQRFVMDYPLRDGCESCALLGYASFAFDFDPAGRFQGASLVKLAAESAPGLPR